MKRFPFFVPLIVAMLVFPYFSCGSAPSAPAQSPSASNQPSSSASQSTSSASGLSQAVSDELNAASARVEEARKRAIDFNGHSYFPSDWESADSDFARAKSMPKTSDSEAQNAIAAYNSAADAFDSIFNLTVPLYAQAREDEIVSLWEELVAAGARDSYPEYFTPADETALSAYDQYEAKDYYAAKDTADKALTMYQALKTGCDAVLIREEITDWGLEMYDLDNFDSADETGITAIDYYEKGDIPSALEKAGESLQQYDAVSFAGWKAYAEEHSLLAEAKRDIALEIKANVAARDLFNEADSYCNSALASFGNKNYEEASKQINNAETLFIEAIEITMEKRRIAEEAIFEANERISESDETARQAEIIMEGGSE